MGTAEAAVQTRPRVLFVLMGIVIAFLVVGGSLVGLFLFVGGSGQDLFSASSDIFNEEPQALPAAHAINVNQAVTSMLTSQHPRQAFRFTLTRPGMVTIQANSQFDNYLELYHGSTNSRLATDDDSGDGLNALITVSLAQGEYIVLFRPYSSGNYGHFTLSVVAPMETAAGPAAPGQQY